MTDFRRASFTRRGGAWYVIIPAPRRRRAGRAQARYGIGPAMKALPELRAENERARAELQQTIVLPSAGSCLTPAYDPATSTWFIENTRFEARTIAELQTLVGPDVELEGYRR